MVVGGSSQQPSNSTTASIPPLQRPVTLKLSGVSLLEAIERACDAARMYGRGDGNGVDGFIGEVSQLAVMLITGVETFEQEFAFHNLPLSEREDQPEELAELTFDEPAGPLSIEALGIGKEQAFRKVQLKAVNHSNKAIHEAKIVMKFLDASDKPLKEQSATLRSPSFDVFSRLVLLGP
jgi:hypothetical protein